MQYLNDEFFEKNCNSFMQGGAEDDADAMARIFVWLRYSASRQLTWQRNYNTQPRILGSSQERLTHKMAEVSYQVESQHIICYNSDADTAQSRWNTLLADVSADMSKSPPASLEAASALRNAAVKAHKRQV